MANASCGVNSIQLAYLMKDLLGVDSGTIDSLTRLLAYSPANLPTC